RALARATAAKEDEVSDKSANHNTALGVDRVTGVDKMIILGTVESIFISNHAASILAIGRFLLVTVRAVHCLLKMYWYCKRAKVYYAESANNNTRRPHRLTDIHFQHPPATTSTSATTPTTTDQRKPSTHANHPSTNPAILFHSHPLRLLHCPEKRESKSSLTLARSPTPALQTLKYTQTKSRRLPGRRRETRALSSQYTTASGCR
ncbi:hypothetical protein RJZ57_008254, partial [Blastomyces gilchristii]